MRRLEKELGIHRYRSRNITIRFRGKIEDYGYCWGDKKDVFIYIRKSDDFDEMMATLAHEMVHAKQYILGDLVDGYLWKGEDYTDCAYKHQPWEQEAEFMEMELFEKHGKATFE